ncbi:MAG: heme biosynthesis HemY N-terminal domain-containing protein [Cocleimonas sp.]
MRYLLIFFAIVGAFWLGIYAVDHSSDIVIKYQWNENPMSVTLTSTTLLIASVLGLVGLYLVFSILKFFFGLRKRLKLRKIAKLTTKASQDLTNGLVQFSEGHWEQSEKILLSNVKYSETPSLNYLVAARSAHMQEAFDRRDKYLKIASDQGGDVQTAVSISQAEMQFSGEQFEQARATLVRLLETVPKHPYAVKLLAKVYYKQEDWRNLFELLPTLSEQGLIQKEDRSKYEATALKGIFLTLAQNEDKQQLQVLWKKLPADIKEKPQAVLVYCKALSDAGDASGSDKLLIASLNKNWDEQLVERYGKIEHKNLGVAIKQGEKWLLDHEKSPMLLLALARLNRNYKLWGKSKSYYNSSLNFSPSADIYLEFAEVLEALEEYDNAQICYKQGLDYSINQKGQILNLKSLRSVDSTLSVVREKRKE